MLPRMRVLPPFLLLFVLLACSSGLHAAGEAGNPAADITPEELEEKAFQGVQEDAAAYRLKRSRYVANAADDAGAAQKLAEAQNFLAEDSNRWATRRAHSGFDTYPYSAHAGELLHTAMRAYIARKNLPGVRDELLRLWFYLPDYPDMGQAMSEALDCVEHYQDFNAQVNLDAQDPRQVVRLGGESFADEINRLFRFLSLHGDRITIAPRASLGLARSLLLAGGKNDVFAARRAYEKFLEDYPTNELTFTALCEQALSHLFTYKGDQYDAGALSFAAAVIEQAALETNGDAAKDAKIKAYRNRIRQWQQDRDLAIAQWYRARWHPWLLEWLRLPPGLHNADNGARFYYREVIKRDPTSKQGLIAERELAAMPAPGADVLTPLNP